MLHIIRFINLLICTFFFRGIRSGSPSAPLYFSAVFFRYAGYRRPISQAVCLRRRRNERRWQQIHLNNDVKVPLLANLCSRFLCAQTVISARMCTYSSRVRSVAFNDSEIKYICFICAPVCVCVPLFIECIYAPNDADDVNTFNQCHSAIFFSSDCRLW